MIIVNILILIIIIVFIIIYKIMDKFYFRIKYKKYKEKYLNLKYGSGRQNKNEYQNNIILIPHAGRKYSGDARKNVFNEIKHEITHIFYIAALHNMGEAKKQFGQKECLQFWELV